MKISERPQPVQAANFLLNKFCCLRATAYIDGDGVAQQECLMSSVGSVWE